MTPSITRGVGRVECTQTISLPRRCREAISDKLSTELKHLKAVGKREYENETMK